MTTKDSKGWYVTEMGDRLWQIYDSETNTFNYLTNASGLIPSGISFDNPDSHFYVHEYNFGHWSQYGDDAASALLRINNNLMEQPAPTWSWDPDGNTEETTGSTSNLIDLEWTGLGGENTVTHIVPLDQSWIVNLTNPDHDLHAGLVWRKAFIQDGKIYIATIGWGNGDLALPNAVGGPAIFGANGAGIQLETAVEYEYGLDNVQLPDSRGTAGGEDDDGATTGTPSDVVAPLFGAGKTNGSPLVIDIDGDGVELVSLNSANAIYWDYDNDGFAEAGGWVGADDGLLAMDVNGDGIIRGAPELFTDQTGDANGFENLKSHDSNDDGAITLEDAVWAELLVWIDENGDGSSQAEELYTMNDLLITNINLSYGATSSTVAGNEIKQESTITINGNTQDIVDAYFAYNNVNSVYDAQVTFDLAAFALPELRGYGLLHDLRAAISLDNDTGDADSLILLMTDFAELDIEDLFPATDAVMEDVRAIMYRWAGVDDIATNSRGSSLDDARILEFLEQMMGEEYRQTGSQNQANPFWNAAADLEEAFWIAQQYAYARLAAQSAGGEIFEGDWRYDPATDSLVGVTGLSTDVIDDLELLASALSNTGEREIFWANVLRMIEFTVGVDNLSGGDETYLDAAITASDVTLDLADIEALLIYDAPTGSPHNGTSGNDTITTGSGNDDIDAGSGNDTINAGTDNDYVKGQLGNDTYIYAVGDGDDVYKEQSTGTGNDNDRILFGAGIDIGDLTFSRAGDDGLLIEIDTGSYQALIALEKHFNYASGGGHIEWLEFNDTTTFDLDGQSWITHGTEGADYLRGIWNGSGGLGNDTIYGYGGNDEISVDAPNEADSLANTVYGGDGNDRIYGDYGVDTLNGENGNDYIEGGSGNDIISGGAGDDHLVGEIGNDTYIYSGGLDYINDQTGTDVINLDAVWNGVTPQYLRTGNDLMIWFNADNIITINEQYGTRDVESMVYANSTTVNLTTVTAISQGTSGNDTLTGTSGVDTIYGHDGDDSITSNNGNDLLYGGNGNDALSAGNNNDYLDGGAGDDSLYGGGLDDTYYYASGHDYIDDSSGTADVLIFANGWEIDEMTFDRYIADDNDLVIGINGTNSVTIEGQLGNTRNINTFTFQAGNVTPTNIVVTLHGTSSGETLTGLSGGGSPDDIIYGYDGADTINGSGGNDTLYGGNGNDTMSGGADNDTLYGGAGDDIMEGNTGTDTYVYESGLDIVTDYNTNSANDALWITSGRTINDIAGFSNVSTSHTKITLTASVDEITVYYLRGGAQHHVEWVKFDDGFITSLPDYAGWLNGTSGNDVVAGNGSDNTLIGFAGNDTITGAGGNDDAHGGAGDDSIDGGAGNDMLHGGVGTDTLTYASATAAVTVSLALTTAQNTVNAGTDTALGFENLTGSAYNDTLTGDVSANVIDGAAGDDTMDGGDGIDTLTYINAGSAITISLATLTGQSTGGAGTDTIVNFENIVGSAYNDNLTGDGYNNTIEGGAGDDTMDGSGGYDTLTYANAGSAITLSLASGSGQATGGAGTDTVSNFENLTGSAYNDTLTGSTGANVIKGGVGNDTISGGDGNDVLYGESGLDAFTGGAGADSFVFEAASAYSNIDTVSDFNTGQDDAINLIDLLSEYDPLTDAITDFVLFATSGGDTNVSVDRDGTGGTYSMAQIATLTGVTGLTDEAALVTAGNLLVA